MNTRDNLALHNPSLDPSRFITPEGPAPCPFRDFPRNVAAAVYAIADAYGFPWEVFRSKRRTALLAHVRGLAIALTDWHSPLSVTAVAAAFEKDHGTVIHWRKKIAKLYEIDPEIRGLIQQIEKEFFGVTDHDKVERSHRDAAASLRTPKKPITTSALPTFDGAKVLELSRKGFPI